MLKKNTEIIHRCVGSFHFLVNPRVSYNSENENLFQTDEIGACIWECLEPIDSFDNVLAKVLECFLDEKTDAFVAMVRDDVSEYINILKCAGYVTEV